MVWFVVVVLVMVMVTVMVVLVTVVVNAVLRGCKIFHISILYAFFFNLSTQKNISLAPMAH